MTSIVSKGCHWFCASIKLQLLTSPSCTKIHILSILFLATRRDSCEFPASTAVAVLAFPSSYLKVPTMERVGTESKRNKSPGHWPTSNAKITGTILTIEPNYLPSCTVISYFQFVITFYVALHPYHNYMGSEWL